jgi:hypothetical protein
LSAETGNATALFFSVRFMFFDFDEYEQEIFATCGSPANKLRELARGFCFNYGRAFRRASVVWVYNETSLIGC